MLCGSDLLRGNSGDGCFVFVDFYLNMRVVRDIFGFRHLLRSLFRSTYNLSVNSMFWKNLHSVLVL